MTAAESHSPQAAHWRLLFGVLRARRGLLGRVFLWSAVAAVPAFLSGRLVAAAVDRGFLANRPALGFGWLGVRELVERLGAGMPPKWTLLRCRQASASCSRWLAPTSHQPGW